eukprot:1187657-Prorocentrum_minimum.AAC.3
MSTTPEYERSAKAMASVNLGQTELRLGLERYIRSQDPSDVNSQTGWPQEHESSTPDFSHPKARSS